MLDTPHELRSAQTSAKLLGVTVTPAEITARASGVEHGGLIDALAPIPVSSAIRSRP